MMFEKQVDVMNQMVDSFISDNNARNEEFFFFVNLVEVRLPTASRWQPFSEFVFQVNFLISHLIVFSSFFDTKHCTCYCYKHIEFNNLFVGK